MSRDTGGIDLGSIQAAAERQSGRVTPGIEDIPAYVARGVVDTSHRDVIGPLLPGAGASGVVVHRGKPITSWGDPTKPEMAFSVSKTMLSIVAGAGFDRGLLHPDEPVVNSVDLPAPGQLT